MKRLIIFLLLFAAIKVAGQTTGYLRFDTVKIMKQNGTCELYIINKTKDSLGLLTNIGGGLTRFIKSRAVGDTLFVGLDTLVVITSPANTNTGTAFRWLNEGTQAIKTVADSWGIKWDSTSTAGSLTAKPDTSSAGVATQHDLLTTPTLQTVANAGRNADSIHVQNMNVSEDLYAPVRAAADTVAAATRRGDIWFDTTTNSMLYRGNSFWAYFSSLSNALIPHRPNMRLIAGVLRPNVSGGTVTWNWIIDAEHDSIGFGGITCTGSAIELALAATAVKIHTIITVPDEQLSGVIDIGTSFQTTKAVITVKRRIGVYSAFLQGNGTNYTTTSTTGGTYTVSYTVASGNLLFDWISAFVPQSVGTSAQYVGTNGYHLERQTSGLSGNDRRYIVKDFFGNAVTANPTTSDIIEIISPDNLMVSINPCTAGGDGWAASVFTGFANIWVIGLIEF